VEVNLRVDNTPVVGVVQAPLHVFLLESTVVGFVKMIWKSSLSTTLPLDVLAAPSAFARENCSVPALSQLPVTATGGTYPLNPSVPVPPLINVTVKELSAVDVPPSPDIVTVGVHALSSGTLLMSPKVITFEAQGKGELCNTMVYRRAGITYSGNKLEFGGAGKLTGLDGDEPVPRRETRYASEYWEARVAAGGVPKNVGVLEEV